MRSFFPPFCRLKSRFRASMSYLLIAAAPKIYPTIYITTGIPTVLFLCIDFNFLKYCIKTEFILMRAFFGTLLKFCSLGKCLTHHTPGPESQHLKALQLYGCSGWRPSTQVNNWELLFISPRDFLSFQRISILFYFSQTSDGNSQNHSSWESLF